ncbi:hypothetical protein LY39_02721 [Roseinatronobacter bogoriensis subsp. barguzinensis]|nr:hypothetical protein LY39_02721 [Rhodobaca barguzinensis]TDY68236.1 hypothetical protein EV660_106142 [Rhodobaca bogoriensis DSM 18756]
MRGPWIAKNHMPLRLQSICLFFLAMLFLPAASDFRKLTVTGPSSSAFMTYDLSELKSMQVVIVNTTTPWTDGLQEFRGVPLAALLPDMDGAFELRLTAVNDYVVTMPSDLMTESIPIVAYERNGALMSVRDKGPFWLIFPFDDNDSFTTDAMLSRSIWQLFRIDILQ